MSRLLAAAVSLGLALTLGACATPADGGNAPSASSKPTPTPDQALVPQAPSSPLTEVDPAMYDDGFGWFSFRAGEGPTWCTITPEEDRVLCEQHSIFLSHRPKAAKEVTVTRFSFGPLSLRSVRSLSSRVHRVNSRIQQWLRYCRAAVKLPLVQLAVLLKM
jgi:hypothetical protein